VKLIVLSLKLEKILFKLLCPLVFQAKVSGVLKDSWHLIELSNDVINASKLCFLMILLKAIMGKVGIFSELLLTRVDMLCVSFLMGGKAVHGQNT
jgi:hypothetical protein